MIKQLTYKDFCEEYEYILWCIENKDEPSKELRADKREIEKEYPKFTERYNKRKNKNEIYKTVLG